MTLAHITDHAARAIARLAAQYAGLTTVSGMASVIGGRTQGLEDAIFAMYTQTSIATATDYSLDVIAHFFQENRGGLSDSAFRSLLMAKILILVHAGEHEAIIPATNLLISEWSAGVHSTESNAAFELSGTAAVASEAEIATALRIVSLGTVGGVRCIIVYYLSPLAQLFTFDAGPGFDTGKFMGAVQVH